MAYKSTTQPLCRYCGKGIPKETHAHFFRQARPSMGGWSTNHPEEPTSKSEAQRLINEKVISVRHHGGHVYAASSWDGESWKDELFCTQKCAALFGRAAAYHKSGLAMPAYHEAVAKRDGSGS
jgi:hypothetical protein